MEIAYWVVGGLLALFNLYAGGIKLVQSKEQLEPMMQWLDTVPMPVARAIGAVEVVGAIGLVLPPLSGVVPALAFAAAIGFVVLQLLALRMHLGRGETLQESAINIVVIVVAAVTVWLATVWL